MRRLYTTLLAFVIALASVTGCKSKEESKLERTVALQHQKIVQQLKPEKYKEIRINTSFGEIRKKYGTENVSSAMKKFEEDRIKGGYPNTFTGVAGLYESLSRFSFDNKTKEKINLVVLAGLHAGSFNVLRYLQLLQFPEYHSALTHEKMIDIVNDVFVGYPLEKLTKTDPIKSLGKIETFLDYLEVEKSFSKARYFDKADGWLTYTEIIERNPKLRDFLTEERTIQQLAMLNQADSYGLSLTLPDSCGVYPTFDDVTERYLKLLIEDKGSSTFLANVSVPTALANVYEKLKEKVSFLTKEGRVSVLEKELSSYDQNTKKLIKKCLCWNHDFYDVSIRSH